MVCRGVDEFLVRTGSSPEHLALRALFRQNARPGDARGVWPCSRASALIVSRGAGRSLKGRTTSGAG
jgi:hypothetical protein